MQDNINFVENLGIRLGYIVGDTGYFYCPFHASKQPHLCVDLNKPIWFCHDQECERGGHLEKLKRLVKNTDLNLSQFEEKDEPIEKETQEILRFANITVEDYCNLQIANNCTYFKENNMTAETINKFGVRRNLLFIVVPARDKRGRIEGLISRAILSKQRPRYQYTTGLKKKNFIFGLDHFVYNGLVVIVEGWSDCAKCHQNGHSNVLAILGSSIGDGQVKQIMQISDKVLILLDNEEKSKKTTRKVAEKLAGMDIYIPDNRRYISTDPGKMEKEELDDIISFPIPYLKAKLKGLL